MEGGSCVRKQQDYPVGFGSHFTLPSDVLPSRLRQHPPPPVKKMQDYPLYISVHIFTCRLPVDQGPHPAAPTPLPPAAAPAGRCCHLQARAACSCSCRPCHNKGRQIPCASGIAAFFSKHRCNSICEHLRIGRSVEQKFGQGTLAPAHAKPTAAGGFKQSPQAARYIRLFCHSSV